MQRALHIPAPRHYYIAGVDCWLLVANNIPCAYNTYTVRAVGTLPIVCGNAPQWAMVATLTTASGHARAVGRANKIYNAALLG